jgi:hypothetical protein
MVPEGKSVLIDKSVRGMLDNIANVNDTWDWDMAGHVWKMTKDGLECTDCPNDNNEESPIHEKTSVEVGPVDIHIETEKTNE